MKNEKSPISQRMNIHLRDFLQSRLYCLSGDWVRKQSNYEGELCEALGIVQKRGRYWDADWNKSLLELKKGKSIWLDLVRYSEVLLKANEDACLEVSTLFFIPDNKRENIIEIVGVQTCELLKFVQLTKKHARFLLDLSHRCPRSLNAQASVTLKDIRQIADFCLIRE